MKKLGMVLLSSCICLISAFSAFAGAKLTPEELEQWQAEQYKYCDPVAQSEGPVSRAAKLVGSDVMIHYSLNGADSYIWGYTEVEDAGKPAYHYTRVEGRENGKVIASKKAYGTGYVEATTADIKDGVLRPITAKVFWGER